MTTMARKCELSPSRNDTTCRYRSFIWTAIVALILLLTPSPVESSLETATTMTTKVSSVFVSTHHRRQHLQQHFHPHHHHHQRPLVLQQRIEERILIDELGVDRKLKSVTATTTTTSAAADQLTNKNVEETTSEPSTNSTPIDESMLVGGGTTFNYRGMNITIGVDELVLPRATRYLTFAFATILVLMSAFCLGFIYRYRQHVIVCVGQPFFLGLVCIGVTFSSIGLYLSAVVEAGIPSIDEGREDMVCVAQSWFYGIGEITVYMALVCKLWRVFRLTRSFQRRKVLAKHAVAPLIIMAVALLAVLIAWTIVDPPTWEQQYFAMSMTESDAAAATFTIQTIGFCDTGGTFSYILIGLSTLSLLSALIMACRTRNIREDLTDSRRIFQTLLCHFLILLVSVGGSIGSTFLESYALYYLSTDVTGFLSSFATLALLIVPKIYYVVYETKTGKLPPRAKTGQEIQQIGQGQGQVHITGLTLPPNSVTDRNDDRRSVVGEGATIRAPSPNKKEEVASSGEERTAADSV